MARHCPECGFVVTEGANYFSTPLSLFFSRRIGAVLPDGDPQRVLEGGKVTVGGAQVTKPDVAASNGVIHVINKVLIPR